MIIGYSAKDPTEEVSSGLLAIWRQGNPDAEIPGVSPELRDRLYTIGTAVIAVITAAAPNICPENWVGTADTVYVSFKEMPWQTEALNNPDKLWVPSRNDDLDTQDFADHPEGIAKILEPAAAQDIGLTAIRYSFMSRTKVREIYTSISWGYVMRMRHLIYRMLSPHTPLQPEDCVPVTGGLYAVEPGYPITYEVAQTQLGIRPSTDAEAGPQEGPAPAT